MSAGGPVRAARTMTLDSLVPTLTSIDPSQVVSGSPLAGSTAFETVGEVEVGVWEHTVGVSSDVETDEVSLILEGSATVSFVDDAGEPTGETAELSPGVLLVLHAGERTRWRVHSLLRKLYVAR